MNLHHPTQFYSLMADLGRLAEEESIEGSLVLLGRQVIDYSLSWSDDRASRFARMLDALCSPLLQGGRTLDSLVLEFEEGCVLVVTQNALRVAIVTPALMERPDDVLAAARSILTTHGPAILRATGQAPATAIPTPAPIATPAIDTGASIAVRPAESAQPLKMAQPVERRPILAAAPSQRTAIPVVVKDAAAAAPVVATPVPAAAPQAVPTVQAEWLMEQLAGRLAMVMGRKTAADLVSREAAATGIDQSAAIASREGMAFIRTVFANVPHKAKREALTLECESLFKASLK